MTDPKLEKSVLRQLSGRRIMLDKGGRELPLSIPVLRRGSNKYLKPRKLRIINALFQKRFLEVVGSPWLPGLWVVQQQEARQLIAAKSIRRPALLMVVTEQKMDDGHWFSFKGEPLMVFDSRWHSMEDYAQGMKKKYRARFNKVHSACAELDVRELPWKGSLVQQMAGMLGQTLEDKVAVLPDNLEELLGQFHRWFGPSFRIFGAFEDERMLAFITLLEDGSVLRAMHYGCEDAAPSETYSLLMFRAIREGIEGPFQEVNLGRTGTEIKSTYGAVAQPNYFSFYTRNPLLRWGLGIVAKRYEPKTFELRSPFKQEMRAPSLESV